MDAPADVTGLNEPESGTVRIGAQDTAALSAEARRALTSVVFQQPYLSSGTIRENVLAGDPGACEEHLRHVLRRARVDEIVQRLPDGLDATVGEGGSTVSGGERQRSSIARALLKSAPVLLIDEAISALDTENEATGWQLST
ncbi:ATP-binding cassette domain-containing protein [Nocardiopsis valliformis]|uniref:ATP-binding cassette domain-containing protein n=1 Tax=Nocardiopsis valliformis TaxID=239974 RepID=UPI00034A2D22|nr:ABC transporter ATP-binding protein [Nocardiopsis valliformis]